MLKLRVKTRPTLIGRLHYSNSPQNMANPASVNAFNANHSLYDKLRPSYDSKFVKYFLKDLGLADEKGEFQSSKPVLELAAGTGKFTDHLVKLGWSDELTVVEPSQGMRETFVKNYPQVSNLLPGDSYKIPLEDNSFDAVIVAQGFHWFSDIASLKEIARVLKPHGKLGLIWNFEAASRAHMLVGEESENLKFLFDDERFKSIVEDVLLGDVIAKEIDKGSLLPERRVRRLVELLAAQTRWGMLAQYVYQYGNEVPQYHHGEWKKVFINQSLFKNTSIVEGFTFKYPKLARELVYPYWQTRSYITSLTDEEKSLFKEKVEELVDSFEDSAFADDTKKDVMMFLGTHYFITEVNK